MPSYQMPHCRRQCEACHTSHVLTSVQGAPKAASAPSAPSDLAASSSILNFQHRSGAMARMRAVGAVATATVLASACLALLPLLASAGCPFKLGLNVGPRDALDEPLLLQRRELLAAAVDQVRAAPGDSTMAGSAHTPHAAACCVDVACAPARRSRRWRRWTWPPSRPTFASC